MRRIAIMGSATVGAIVATTFAITAATAPSASAAELTPFKDCGQLRDWYVATALPSVTAWGWGGGLRMYGPIAEAGAADSAGVPTAAKDAQSNSATGTNVQEAGVDEPDYVKTNGSLLVRIVGNNRLVVTDVSKSTPRELGRVDFPDDMYGSQLLLVGDTVVVSGGTNSPALGGPIGGPAARDSVKSLLPINYGSAESRLLTISIQDPSHPRVVSDRRLDGSILTMRQYGDVVRVVLTTSYPPLDFIYPSKNVTEKQALAHNKQAVKDSTISDWLPTIKLTAKGAGQPLVACTDVSHPTKQSGFGTISILAFPASNIDNLHTVAVTAGGNLVYSSTDRLYLATTSWGWVGGPMMAVPDVGVAEAPGAVQGDTAQSDAAAPDSISSDQKPAAPSPESTQSEPGASGSGDGAAQKSAVGTLTPKAISAPAPKDVTTEIHSFAIDGLDTTYLASGQVKGLVRDRWSMSEYNGDLRVAVGLGQAWNPTDNGVAVLRDEGSKLVTIGRVRGLGTNEQIQSVRWLGPLAVIVTFRQIDPLYTVDLSDPTNPTVLGALKIPGFSSYLHPIGNGMLVGIGQDATNSGRTKGGQAAVFDISNPSHPSRLSTYSFGRNTQPTAGWEPRSFTYLPDQNAVLTSVWDPQGQVKEFVLSIGSDGSLTTTDVVTLGGGSAEQTRALPLGNGRVALVNGLITSILTVG